MDGTYSIKMFQHSQGAIIMDGTYSITMFQHSRGAIIMDSTYSIKMFQHSRGAIIMDGTYSIKILNAQATRNAIIFSKMGFYLNYMNIRTVWCTELHTMLKV
jgi:hypothetical protein